MRLSISNIAWANENDEEMYSYMSEIGYEGLEIAPTRIFPECPYERLEAAKHFANIMREQHALQISSLQSIWFGMSQNLFGSEYERKALLNHTKRAIRFAQAMDCKNLVLGSPRNRNIQHSDQYVIAVEFFREIGTFAQECGTVVAVEANPKVYNTNFINNTSDAFKLVQDVQSQGFLVNLDIGTVIQNKEDILDFADKISFVNHVHISEPFLKDIFERKVHFQLAQMLHDKEYSKYVSLEMQNMNDLERVKQSMNIIRDIFKTWC